jgi:hypothetical protein
MTTSKKKLPYPLEVWKFFAENFLIDWDWTYKPSEREPLWVLNWIVNMILTVVGVLITVKLFDQIWLGNPYLPMLVRLIVAAFALHLAYKYKRYLLWLYVGQLAWVVTNTTLIALVIKFIMIYFGLKTIVIHLG